MSLYRQKTIRISKEQDDFLKNKPINFSKFVRIKIDELKSESDQQPTRTDSESTTKEDDQS